MVIAVAAARLPSGPGWGRDLHIKLPTRLSFEMEGDFFGFHSSKLIALPNLA